MAITSKIWRFFIVDDNGLSYYVDDIGNVQGPVTRPTKLKYAPMGWDDVTINWERNTKYFGINRSYTGNLKFVKDGAIILRYLLYNRGVQAKVYLVASKYENVDFNVYYRGECDLSEADDDPKTGITVPLIEGGPVKFLKANESTEYEVPCNGTVEEAIEVLFDGTELEAKFTFAFSVADVRGGPNGRMSIAVPFNYLSSTGQNFGVVHGSPQFQNFNPGEAFDLNAFKTYAATSQSNGFFRESVPTTFDLAGTFEIQDGNSGPSSILKAMFVTSAGQVSSIYDSTISQGQFVAIPFTVSLNLAANEGVFLLLFNDSGETGEAVLIVQQQTFTAAFTSRVPESAAYVLKPLDMFKKLVKLISNGIYEGESSLLDGLSWCVFSGENIRGKDDAVIKLSLNDFIGSSFLKKRGGALGIRQSDQKILFETKAYFFDNSITIIDLGEVSGFKIKVAKDYLFSTIKAGSADQNTSQQEENYEFNTENTFSTPIDRVTTTLDLVSKIRCDSSGIEQMRADIGNVTTTDNKMGSTVFMVDVAAVNTTLPVNPIVAPAVFTLNPYQIRFAGKYSALSIYFITGTVFGVTASAFNNKVFTVITAANDSGDLLLTVEQYTTAEIAGGIVINFNFYRLNRSITVTSGSNPADAASVYNVDMSPARDIYRNGDYLNIGMFGMPNEFIKFTASKKNANLVAGGISESGAFLPGQLPAPFALPFMFECQTRVAQNIILLMQQAGRGKITGKYLGRRWHGFADSISVKPSFQDSQTWTMLASILTDTNILAAMGQTSLIIENMGIISNKNSTQFVPEQVILNPEYHFQPMNTNWFKNRIASGPIYDVQAPYFQKRQRTQTEPIQYLTQGVSVTASLIDENGTTIDTITFTNTTNPAVILPNIFWLATLDWSQYPAGVYYLVTTFGVGAGSEVYISEPYMTADDWPHTILLEYTNSQNTPDMIFQPAGTFSGKLRIEGCLINFKPGMKMSQYEDQPLDVALLYGLGYRGYYLFIGSGDYGVPDYGWNKVSLILSECDQVTADGLGITPEIGAKWEDVEISGSPYCMAGIQVRETNNSAGIQIGATGEASSSLLVIDRVNTKGFSNNQSPNDNQQDNIIEVISID